MSYKVTKPARGRRDMLHLHASISHLSFQRRRRRRRRAFLLFPGGTEQQFIWRSELCNNEAVKDAHATREVWFQYVRGMKYQEQLLISTTDLETKPLNS